MILKCQSTRISNLQTKAIAILQLKISININNQLIVVNREQVIVLIAKTLGKRKAELIAIIMVQCSNQCNRSKCGLGFSEFGWWDRYGIWSIIHIRNGECEIFNQGKATTIGYLCTNHISRLLLKIKWAARSQLVTNNIEVVIISASSSVQQWIRKVIILIGIWRRESGNNRTTRKILREDRRGGNKTSWCLITIQDIQVECCLQGKAITIFS